MSALLTGSVYFYFAAAAATGLLLKSRNGHRFALGLFLCAHFNVTALFDAGIAFTFFDVMLFVGLFFASARMASGSAIAIVKRPVDGIFYLFIVLSLGSIIVSGARREVGDLVVPVGYPDSPAVRSLNSLARFIFYLISLVFIRRGIRVEKQTFLKMLGYSGIPPTTAAFIQSAGLGISLFHNNRTFIKSDPAWLEYVGLRPVGLSNEASFYAALLAFSFLALYEAYRLRAVRKVAFGAVSLFYLAGVVLSLSRLGLVLMLFVIFMYNWRTFLKPGIALPLVAALIVFLALLSRVNVYGFNMLDRLISVFSANADLSTNERYGVSAGLLNLSLNKSLALGVGIYNYMYYIGEHLPPWFAIEYPPGYYVPSFNFLIQLAAEWGWPAFLSFCCFTAVRLRNVNDPFVNKWFLLLGLALSSFQMLTFGMPFLILLWPAARRKNR